MRYLSNDALIIVSKVDTPWVQRLLLLMLICDHRVEEKLIIVHEQQCLSMI